MTTLDTNSTTGVLLTGSITNPVTIAAGVTVSGPDQGVSGDGVAWTIANNGDVSGGAGGAGITLASGGAVTNNAAGSISGGEYGVAISGAAGTIANAGTILSSASGGSAVHLQQGGGITNLAGALISGATGIELSGAATLVNAGTVVGVAGVAVAFSGTGASRLVIDPGALFSGFVEGSASASSTVELAAGETEGTLTGLGTSFTNFGTLTVDAGAAWLLSGTNTMAAAVTLTDSGTLINTGALTGAVTLGSGGSLANSGTMTAGANYGVFSGSADAAVSNTGEMTGGFSEVLLALGGSVTNSGSIGGIFEGVYLSGPGSVTNAAGATISGFYAIQVELSPATIFNAGAVISTDAAGYGLQLADGGSVTNASGGLISSLDAGIEAGGRIALINAGTIWGTAIVGVEAKLGTLTNEADGLIIGATGVQGDAGITLTNAGTIAGTDGTAVALAGTGGNLVVIDPGAIFSGLVEGSASASNALELASAANAGALGGLGSSFVNFGMITVDAGASWALDDANTLAAGSTLTNAGTLTLDGASLSDDGDIVNNSLITLASSALGVRNLTGTGTVDIAASGTLAVQATLGAGETVRFGGAGNAVLSFGDAAAVLGAVSGLAAGDTIDVTDLAFAASTTSVRVAGGTLTLTNGGQTVSFAASGLADGTPLDVSADGASGTDIILGSGPAAPADLALAPPSDSGTPGDDTTDIAAPVITGAGATGATVTLRDGTFVVGTALVMDGAWSVITSALTPGTHTLTATQTDTLGDVSATSAALALNIVSAPAAPSGLTLAPTSDSGTPGDDTTDIAAPVITGSGATGATVTLRDGTFVVGTALVVDGAWSVTTSTLTPGTHPLTATQIDTLGDVSTVSAPLALNIVSAPAAPTGLTLAPASDSGVAGDDITNQTTPVIDGVGTFGDIVTLFDGTAQIGSTAVSQAGVWTITANLADGVHALTGVQTDADGDVSGTSAELALTIVTHAAAPTITANTGQNESAATVEGAAPDNASVTIFDGATALGTTTASATGLWSFAFATALGAGAHSLTAIATDIAGNVSPASAVLTLQGQSSGPSSVFSAPTPNGGTTEDTYNTGGTLTEVDTLNAAGQLLQSLTDTSAILEIYDAAGTLIGSIQQANSSPTIQPSFATTAETSWANSVTSPDGSQITLLSEGNLITSNGPDSITAGSGSDTIFASGPSISITGGPGSLLFVGGSGGSTVTAGTGSATLFGGTGGGLLQGGAAGHNALLAGGGDTTLVGGGAGDTLVGAAGNATLVMQPGGVAFGGSGAASVFSAGGAVLVGGSGSICMVGGAAGHDAMWGGTGTTGEFGTADGDTLVGGGAGQTTMLGGSGDTLFVGMAGAATAYGGGGNDVFFASGGGAMSIVEGAGNDEVLLAGGGSNAITGGAGTDLYDLLAAAGQPGGTDVISGFKVGTDQLRLFGYDLGAVQQTVAGGSTVLTLADGTNITLVGVTHLAGGSIV